MTKQIFKKTSKLSHYILLFSAGFIFICILWAYFAKIDEITHAPGKVIPSKKVQVIQNLEGGIVKKILVREGERVSINQILMYMDDTLFNSTYSQGKNSLLSTKLKIERLNAEINDKPFIVDPIYIKNIPDVVTSERNLYSSKLKEREILNSRLKLVTQEINLSAPLVAEGAASKVEIIRLEQKRKEIESSIAEFKRKTLNELDDANQKLSQLQEGNISLKDRLDRTAVRSPVNGVVQQIYISTVGGVIQPGMKLIEIVPLDDNLLIEARVKPADVGFIHEGQKAIAYITAYDFTMYGGLDGKVVHISADTTTDEDKQSYYEVWVRTARNYLGPKQKPLAIVPGMQASVDIITGQKTVLGYILKPILKAQRAALKEK